MPWWVWLLAALALGGAELLSGTFVLMWIGLAALVTTVVALATDVLWVQAVCFVVVSVVLLWFTRGPSRRLRQRRTYAGQVESLVGATATVVTPAEPEGLATVRVRGQVWSARSRHPLVPGQTVVVVAAAGPVLEVAAVDGQGRTPGDARPDGRPGERGNEA
ncbi:membrane protein [Alicyclobacillus cellulosilyticus]|uniref:Membrane protein n=1 Tax=Alicyclobacillus cellulosilyticus TaxID=1003997 RepID=A0A917K984_9BACL|nr:NfeD family protein [Alicyclobacillus cellulosilyticus]GGJ05890.1 membrane protein [Alicyclobacillus cellulosilyticus]